MAQQRIDIMIPANGDLPQIRPTGIPGPACKAETADIERDLGGEVVEFRREPAWTAKQDTQQKAGRS